MATHILSAVPLAENRRGFPQRKKHHGRPTSAPSFLGPVRRERSPSFPLRLRPRRDGQPGPSRIRSPRPIPRTRRSNSPDATSHAASSAKLGVFGGQHVVGTLTTRRPPSASERLVWAGGAATPAICGKFVRARDATIPTTAAIPIEY